MEMEKTFKQIPIELGYMINNYKENIVSAFKKGDYDLTLTIKVILSGNLEKTTIAPSIEFYPESKVKSEKYTITVDEKQISLPLRSVGKVSHASDI